MELQQLNYFKTVAEIGKISDAAQTLFISAPALSTSISRLEKELGMQLFDRTNNKITLNQQGQIFLRYVNQIFISLENAKTELHRSMQRQGPNISILSVNSAMWADLITAFTSEHPQFTLSCATETLSKLASSGLPVQYSFLLAYETDVPASLAQELDNVFLLENYPMVMVHPENPLARESSIDVDMLKNETIFMPAPDYSLHNRLLQLFEYRNVLPPSENSYSLLARRQMVSKNLGVSFVTKASRYVGCLDRSELRYIPLENPLGPWRTRLYWRKDRPLTEYETVFKKFTEEYFQNLH